jgi:hypothetical protein
MQPCLKEIISLPEKFSYRISQAVYQIFVICKEMMQSAKILSAGNSNSPSNYFGQPNFRLHDYLQNPAGENTS